LKVNNYLINFYGSLTNSTKKLSSLQNWCCSIHKKLDATRFPHPNQLLIGFDVCTD